MYHKVDILRKSQTRLDGYDEPNENGMSFCTAGEEVRRNHESEKRRHPDREKVEKETKIIVSLIQKVVTMI